MLTAKPIESLYKTYRRRPESVYDLNFAPLFERLTPDHGIEVTEDELLINSLSANSPFHAIPLEVIHQIVELEEEIAIVLHSSIIILNKADNKVNVHMKMMKPTFWEKLKYKVMSDER